MNEPEVRRTVVRHKSGGNAFPAVVLEATFDGESRPYHALFETSGDRQWWTFASPLAWPELSAPEIAANPEWNSWVNGSEPGM